MTVSIPRSVPTTPVVQDRNATIGLTMAATVLAIGAAAAVVLRVLEALSTASVDQILTVGAFGLSLAIVIGVGALVARDAEYVRPMPKRAVSEDSGSR